MTLCCAVGTCTTMCAVYVYVYVYVCVCVCVCACVCVCVCVCAHTCELFTVTTSAAMLPSFLSNSSSSCCRPFKPKPHVPRAPGPGPRAPGPGSPPPGLSWRCGSAWPRLIPAWRSPPIKDPAVGPLAPGPGPRAPALLHYPPTSALRAPRSLLL